MERKPEQATRVSPRPEPGAARHRAFCSFGVVGVAMLKMKSCSSAFLLSALRRCWPLVLGPTLCAVALAAPPVAPPAPVVGASARLPGDLSTHVLACTACHGKEGRATPQGYFPRIAGKPAEYLYHQLLNFREGRRSYPQMGYLLENLTDAYLHDMALHFAALQVPYPAAPAPQAPAAVLERGRVLVQQGDAARRLPACVQCHGQAMTGVQPAIPGLLGLPRDYLNAQLGAWQTGQRRAQAPDCMGQVAQKLTPAEVSAISAWLAAQPVPDGGRPAAALPAPLPLRCGGVALASEQSVAGAGGVPAPAGAQP